MSITAPLEVELQHDDIQVIDDDITIVPELASADALVQSREAESEPLLPFLVLGVLNLIAMLAVAIILAF